MKFPGIIVGETLELQRLVDETVVAGDNWSSGVEALLSTPGAVELMQESAVELLEPRLPEGFMSVGKRADIVHETPAVLGAQITVRIEIQGFDGYHIQLGMQISNGSAVVVRGHHERSIVNRRWMEAKLNRLIGSTL